MVSFKLGVRALGAALLAPVACGSTGSDAASASDSAYTETPETVDVPLHNILRNSGGGRGLALDVGVGGAGAKPLVVDTGSAGIHILAADIPNAKVTRTGKKIVETYVDGTSLVGEEALAIATIGGVDSVKPIAVHLVDEVTCSASRPNCGNGGTKDDPKGLRFFHDTGVSGLVGVGISNANAEPSVFSPLAQMPGNLASGYIVQTSGYYGDTGELTIGLTAASRATFKATEKLALQPYSLPNGVTAWEDAKVTVCYSLAGTDIQDECVRSIIDTGATAFFWNTQKLRNDQMDTWGDLNPGLRMSIHLPGQSPSWTFTVSDHPVPGIDLVISSPNGFNSNLGIGAYFRFDVMSDVANGVIGLRDPVLPPAPSK